MGCNEAGLTPSAIGAFRCSRLCRRGGRVAHTKEKMELVSNEEL